MLFCNRVTSIIHSVIDISICGIHYQILFSCSLYHKTVIFYFLSHDIYRHNVGWGWGLQLFIFPRIYKFSEFLFNMFLIVILFHCGQAFLPVFFICFLEGQIASGDTWYCVAPLTPNGNCKPRLYTVYGGLQRLLLFCDFHTCKTGSRCHMRSNKVLGIPKQVGCY